jgi:2-phospho-L-lactate guanylyltransferase
MPAREKRAELAVVVLQKSLAAAKTRLRSVLSKEARLELTGRMLRATLEVCHSLTGTTGVYLCGPEEVCGLAADCGACVIPGGAGGMRRDIAAAAQDERIAARAAMLFVSADLPLLTADDLAEVVAAWRACNDVVLGPDRRERGTNVMLLNEPEHFPYCFGEVVGPGSFTSHLSTAVGLGLACVVVRRPGIQLDLDLPEDLVYFAGQAPEHPLARYVKARMQESFRFE